MSVIGLKVGPFEIVEPAFVPEPGHWFLARRAGLTSRRPENVLVRLLPVDTPEERSAVQRQYETLRGIEDPRVPTPIAYYEGLSALAIAAVVGAPLSDAHAGRRDESLAMTPGTLLDVLLEIAESLQRVHHRNRHHGHLGPHNVMLAPEGSVWLFGFGASGGATGVEPDPGFVAPERARGEPSTAASDQWSVGAIAIGLISGLPVWRSEDPVAEALRGDASASIDGIDRQWPALGRVLRRTLDPHPANRFPSMHALRQELLALARKVGGTSERREVAQALARRRPTPKLEEELEPGTTEASAEATTDAAPPPVSTPTAALGSVAVAAPAQEPAQPDVTPAGAAARPVRRPLEKLPEEQIPIVRPELDGDLPLAARGSSGQLADEAAAAAAAAIAPQRADVEPSEETVLYSESQLAAALADSEPSHEVAAQIVDEPAPANAVWQDDPSEDRDLDTQPTAVPITESSTDSGARQGGSLDEPSELTDHLGWFGANRPPTRTDPSLGLSGVPTPLAEPQLAPEDEGPLSPAQATGSAARPFPVRMVAPALVATMLVLLLLWAARWVFG